MPPHGKRFRAALTLVDRDRSYQPAEAVALVKQTAKAKFNESVEVAVRLGVDPRHADQVVRGTVVLPHGTGKSVRVLVVAQGDKAKALKKILEFMESKKVQKTKTALPSCLLIVGAMRDASAAKAVLGYLDRKQPPAVRNHALLALFSLPLEGKDASGAVLNYTLEGKIDNLALHNRSIAGTWKNQRESGKFQIVRQ